MKSIVVCITLCTTSNGPQRTFNVHGFEFMATPQYRIVVLFVISNYWICYKQKIKGLTQSVIFIFLLVLTKLGIVYLTIIFVVQYLIIIV